jgi:hypothetical protein
MQEIKNTHFEKIIKFQKIYRSTTNIQSSRMSFDPTVLLWFCFVLFSLLLSQSWLI